MTRGFCEFVAVALPKAINGGLTILFNILLLRHLGPEGFGAYSLCISLILVVDGTLGSAIDLGVLRLATERRLAAGSARTGYTDIDLAGLYLKLGVGAVGAGLLAVLAEPLGTVLFHGHGQGRLLQFTGASALGLLLLRSILVHLQASGRFILYGLCDLIHSLLKFGGISLLMLWWTPEPEHILAAFALAPLSIALFGAVLVGRGGRLGAEPRGRPLTELAQQIKWFLATYVVTASVSRMDIFLLTHWSNLEQVGLFSAAQAFAAIPELLGTYMAVVLNPKVIPYCREGRFLAFFRRFQLLCLAAGGLILGIAVLGQELFLGTLLPSSFARSADLFLILLPGCLVSMAVFPLVLPYLMFVRPRFFLLMDILSVPLLLALYAYAIQTQGAIGAAWVTSLARVAKGLIAQFAALWLASGAALPADPKPAGPAL